MIKVTITGDTDYNNKVLSTIIANTLRRYGINPTIVGVDDIPTLDALLNLEDVEPNIFIEATVNPKS